MLKELLDEAQTRKYPETELFDALMLTSREDTYPLVVIEAAFAKVPSLVFGANGGIKEFVNGVGWVIDNMDSDLMADCILSLQKETLMMKGAMSYQKALNQHANSNLINQQIGIILQ